MEVLLCLLFVGYLWPFAVAARHEHERLGAVLALNLLAGWTGIGWWLALRWARRPAPPAPEPEVRVRRGHLRLLAPPSQGGPPPPAPGRVPAPRPSRVRERGTR